ncbi:MAG: WYL domain-containing protein [Gammaproteobacteria bacterium]|nr:WYL domain-containing protein [Gammaproteobacteria bacterium]
MDVDQICFSQRQRLTFIESVAYWEGAVDRPRVSSAFGVSENHVTKDFRLYKNAFPDNLRYDESSRVYRPTHRFKPRIGRGSAEEYLSLLRTHVEGQHAAMVPELGGMVRADVVPQPQGRIQATVLNLITRAISSRTGLEVSYQSRSSSKPSTRCIWPHALVFSGIRWHARAYDEVRNTFIDVVPQRILSAKAFEAPSPSDPSDDTDWNTQIDIDVIPARSLSAGQANAIAQEYGMVKVGRTWVWKVRLRKCIAGYFMYLYRLDLEKDPERLIELRDRSLAKRYQFLTSANDDPANTSNGTR